MYLSEDDLELPPLGGAKRASPSAENQHLKKAKMDEVEQEDLGALFSSQSEENDLGSAGALRVQSSWQPAAASVAAPPQTVPELLAARAKKVEERKIRENRRAAGVDEFLENNLSPMGDVEEDLEKVRSSSRSVLIVSECGEDVEQTLCFLQRRVSTEVVIVFCTRSLENSL